MGTKHNVLCKLKQNTDTIDDISSEEQIERIVEEQKIKSNETVIGFLGAKGSGKSTIINTIVKHYRSTELKYFIRSKYKIGDLHIYERTDPIIEQHAAKSLKYLDLIHKYPKCDATTIASKVGQKIIRQKWSVFIKDYDLLFMGYMHEIETNYNKLEYIYRSTPMDIIHLIHKYYPSKSIVTVHKIKVNDYVYDLWEINEEELDIGIIYKFINYVVYVTDLSQFDALNNLNLFKMFITVYSSKYEQIFFLQNKEDLFTKETNNKTHTNIVSVDDIFEQFAAFRVPHSTHIMLRYITCGLNEAVLCNIFETIIAAKKN